MNSNPTICEVRIYRRDAKDAEIERAESKKGCSSALAACHAIAS
jgi:hypothetical protein